MARMGKLAAALLLVCAATAVQGQRRFPALIVMGDSLSDNGNGWVASGRTMPTPAQGYFQGRFSDGPVWSDYIENATGVNIEVLNTGYPGAQACAPQTPNAGMPFFVPYLAQQAEIVANNSRSLNNNRAVFIWVGANDLSGLAQALLGGQLNLTSALALVPSVASCIRQTAEGLLRFGITRSLTISTVQNIAIQPIWGVALQQFGVPEEFRPMLLTQIGTLVRALNDEIRTIASDLSDSYRRAVVTTFDMYGLYYSIARDGPAEGLTNVTHACLDVDGWANPSGAPYNNVTGLCAAPSGPDTYMFWDYSHPSTVTHSYLAERIYHHLVGVSDIFF